MSFSVTLTWISPNKLLFSLCSPRVIVKIPYWRQIIPHLCAASCRCVGLKSGRKTGLVNTLPDSQRLASRSVYLSEHSILQHVWRWYHVPTVDSLRRDQSPSNPRSTSRGHPVLPLRSARKSWDSKTVWSEVTVVELLIGFLPPILSPYSSDPIRKLFMSTKMSYVTDALTSRRPFRVASKSLEQRTFAFQRTMRRLLHIISAGCTGPILSNQAILPNWKRCSPCSLSWRSTCTNIFKIFVWT